MVTDSGASSGIPYQFYNYTLTEENQYVYNRYTQLFKSISRANTLLAHLGDVSYANPDSRNTYEAEVRFIRALTYFHLVTEWGDVLHKVVTAASGNFGGKCGRYIGSVHLVERDGNAVGFTPLLHEGGEPFVVTWHEVLPLQNL